MRDVLLVVSLVVILLFPVLLILLTRIEPGAYDPEKYVDEWRRKKGQK